MNERVDGQRKQVSGGREAEDVHSRNNCALDLRSLGIRERSELVSYLKQRSVVRVVDEQKRWQKECGEVGFGLAGTQGRSQLPLEFNRRPGRSYPTRIWLVEYEGKWTAADVSKALIYTGIRISEMISDGAWRVLEKREREEVAREREREKENKDRRTAAGCL